MSESGFRVGVLTQVGDPTAYFQQLEDRFQAAARACPDQLVEQDFRVAGQRIRARIVGAQLADFLTRPFAHLRVASSDDSLALRWDCWDGEATGTARPPPPPDEIILRQNADERAVYRTLGQNWIDQLERHGADRWIHGPERQIIGWYESAATCPISERTRPLMDVLPRWLPTTDRQMYHAALVASGGRGAMLIGPSGAGKTTTALACLTGGLDFLGDDHCAVSLDAGAVVGYSLFAAGRLFPEDLDRFPALRPAAVTDTHEDKALVLLHPTFKQQLPSSVPLRALLLPQQISGSESFIRPATSMQVALALMPSMRLLTPDLLATAFERYTGLAERLPCFWLDLGHDLKRVPPVIASLLQSLDD